MVGEIRDFETAEIAVKAALTGHLVLSTLHTNDAPVARSSRLLNMGIEPFLVTASVNLILAQRLARKICADCKQPVESSTTQALLDVGVTAGADRQASQLMQGRGLPDAATTPATRAASRSTRSCRFWDGAEGAGASRRLGGRAQAGGDPRWACRPCA